MKTKMKKEKGFTLIELLVVVAVIAILASVVLVNLRGARERAMDSRIASALGQTRAVAEIINTRDGGSYAALCTGTTSLRVTDLVNGLDDIQAEIIANLPAGTPTPISCQVTPTTGLDYCVSARLNSIPPAPDQFWCVNSGGRSGRATSACATATTGCAGVGF